MMINWAAGRGPLQFARPQAANVSSLTSLPEYFNKLQQQQLTNKARQKQMAMQEQRFKVAQAQQAQANQFRNKQFEADQDYRNRSLGLQEKRLNQPPQRPWWAKSDGTVDPAMAAKTAAGRPQTNVTVNGNNRQTKGRIKLDQTFAKTYEEFVASGGFADGNKNLAQLNTVIKRLKSGDELTGSFTGNIPDTVRTFTNPKSLEARQDVEEVVQRNLRIVLGAQFTEREGERLIARAYNDKLDEKVNARRLERLMKAMRQTLVAKQRASKYFEKHGTLTGYEGATSFTIADIEKKAGLEPVKPDAATPSKAQSILDKYGIK